VVYYKLEHLKLAVGKLLNFMPLQTVEKHAQVELLDFMQLL
jgi:hypothetical protein